jgi:putative addiction module killer protein
MVSALFSYALLVSRFPNLYPANYNQAMFTGQPLIVEVYVQADGTVPLDEWLDDMRDRHARYQIEARIRRLELGNPGKYRTLTDGIFEMKIDHGPGYRVYFARRGATAVLLLCGGDKSTQDVSIKTAIRYWEDFQQRNQPHE